MSKRDKVLEELKMAVREARAQYALGTIPVFVLDYAIEDLIEYRTMKSRLHDVTRQVRIHKADIKWKKKKRMSRELLEQCKSPYNSN